MYCILSIKHKYSLYEADHLPYALPVLNTIRIIYRMNTNCAHQPICALTVWIYV